MTGAASWPAERWAPGRRAFLVVAPLGSLLLLALGAGMTFFADEWAFIESRSLSDPASWFRPHNEHWSTLPVVLYRLMVETIGIGSYMPYLAAVIVLHVCVAALVFRLVARRLGSFAGFVTGILILLFGSGFENLYWGFQIGFVGSMALGLAALDIIDRGASARRAVVVATLLVAALMASGVGLLFCVAIGVEWLLDRRWRAHVPVLLLPAAAYAGWYVVFGRAGAQTFRNPFTPEAIADVPDFVLRGFAQAAQSFSGLPSLLAIFIVGGMISASLILGRKGQLPARVPALMAAVLIHYALIGLTRGGLLVDQVNYTRYTYVSGILLLVALATLAGAWEFPRAARRRLELVVGVAVLGGLAAALNVALLLGGRELFLARADMTRAIVTVGLARPLPPTTDPARSLVLVPSPVELARIVREHGDPKSDSLVPGRVRPIPEPVMTEAHRRLREGAPIPVAEN